ncbi:hypothetical protein [Nocardia sp. NPDC052566]|uniref:hypothetical protein n=1 Tax=Nocardia sp. NPDC052566 TaxID=3364330 RepID=UPI0037C8DF05
MSDNEIDRIPPGIRLGVVRGITYGLFGPPEPIVAPARGIGAGVIRVYLYWSQIEPEPGRFVWDAVDTLLAQLDGDEEVWVTVSSSSMWATRRATDMLPPSPARDLDTFAAFVRRLVERCRGRVMYWQCDNEPSIPILWAGTAAEYVAQLKVFAAAVRAADPAALVTLGGLPPGGHRPGVFEYIAEHARDDFDVFDIHLYGDPYGIPEQIAAARKLMAAHGYQKPVVAGEYNGPVLFQFPELMGELGAVFAGFGAQMVGTDGEGTADAEWTATTTDTGPAPEHEAMADLYARMAELPPRIQMFMENCPPEYEQLRHRWNSRDIVMRNVLALSAGVRRTLCWNLAPESPAGGDIYSGMVLLFNKFKLMDYEGDRIAHRYPSAAALALTARMLSGTTVVVRREFEGHPELYVFEIERASGPLLVAWERRDDVTGEAQPPALFHHPWSAATAHAVNAYGEPVPVETASGAVHFPISLTPLFIEPLRTD